MQKIVVIQRMLKQNQKNVIKITKMASRTNVK